MIDFVVNVFVVPGLFEREKRTEFAECARIVFSAQLPVRTFYSPFFAEFEC